MQERELVITFNGFTNVELHNLSTRRT